MAPSAFLFPINLATLRVLGLPMMKWMVRRISRRTSRLVFYCHPHEFVHAHRQSFPHNMSKWNMQGMKPENFFVLDRFVEHMLLEDYSSTLFANSFSQAFASQHEANANMRDFRPMQSKMFMRARLTLPAATGEIVTKPHLRFSHTFADDERDHFGTAESRGLHVCD